jgi:hypothetical protein
MLGGIVGVALAFRCTRLILRLAFQDNQVAITAMPQFCLMIGGNANYPGARNN